MHHRMPPSKTGWPSLNVVIFPPVMRLVLNDPKQWPPPPQIIDQIHELILEDRRISAKSITEQLGISRERVGSITNLFHKEKFIKQRFRNDSCQPQIKTLEFLTVTSWQVQFRRWQREIKICLRAKLRRKRIVSAPPQVKVSLTARGNSLTT